MNTRAELLLWAQRVIARKTAAAHEILELKADSTALQAQEAFHKIARTAHPDLHRKALTPEELETVTSAYAISAGAYQTMRNQTVQTTRMKPIEASDVAERSGQTPPAGMPAARPTPLPTRPPATMAPTRPTPVPPGVTPPPTPAATPAGPAPGGNVEQKMSSKALLYYRKAELALKRGDLKGAVLQIKLAIASDPASGFLRTALAEVELELRKGT